MHILLFYTKLKFRFRFWFQLNFSSGALKEINVTNKDNVNFK